MARNWADADPGASYLGDLYRSILTENALRLGDVLRAIVAADGTPSVVHCSAGKDRTGVVAAVLLSLLGVSEADVLDDYELSSRYRSEARARELVAMLGEAGVPPAVVAGLLGTPRPAMGLALAAVRSRHGSIEGYLVEAAGLRDADVRRLRDLLLVP
jgi:protein-tyrosine phosphatase